MLTNCQHQLDGCAGCDNRSFCVHLWSRCRCFTGEPVTTRWDESGHEGSLNEAQFRDVLKTCGPHFWFRWALEQFNLFSGAPYPQNLSHTGKGAFDEQQRVESQAEAAAWVPRFRRWLTNTDDSGNRKKSAGQFLLHMWDPKIRIRGAEAIELAMGSMDMTNRAAVVRVLQSVRYF